MKANIKNYIKLFLMLIMTSVLLGQENPAKDYVLKPKPRNQLFNARKAAESDYIETFADSFNDPDVLIGIFESELLPFPTTLSSGEILEELPVYQEALIKFSLVKLHCVKSLKGKFDEKFIFVTMLPPPRIEAAPTIPAFIPMGGSKWILALKKTTKEYRKSRFGRSDEEMDKYQFINDSTMFEVFRYGHGALCLKWPQRRSDEDKITENIEEREEQKQRRTIKLKDPKNLIRVSENTITDLEDILKVMPLIQKENKNQDDSAAIVQATNGLRSEVVKNIYAKFLEKKIEKGKASNNSK